MSDSKALSCIPEDDPMDPVDPMDPADPMDPVDPTGPSCSPPRGSKVNFSTMFNL